SPTDVPGTWIVAPGKATRGYMIPRTRFLMCSRALVAAYVAVACSDSPSEVVEPEPIALDSVRVTTSVRWNQRAVALVVARPPATNGQAAVSRILTYLSLAQYRAVLAAEALKQQVKPPSVAAAVGGASVAVLNSFFPLDVAANEGQLNGDLAVPPWPATRNEDVVAGEAIGRKVGADVLAFARSDNYLAIALPALPVGSGYWVSAAAPIVRSLYGARPFFMTDPGELRSPPPPAFGSPEYMSALTEVRAISDKRTPAELAIAQFWNTSSGPFTAGALNLIADDVIREQRRSESEAARILAFANAAAFDAQIACFDTKFTYWFIRPSQADPAISLPIGLPNHPSYPSAHSCITGAIMTVLVDAFPSERSRLEGIIEEAGMSRVYGGIHYRFDILVGREIGRAAAALALKGSLK
ncbi:MAG: vanadium-dependent haloperoxidase, partial [Gemmatimonadaceae bacterium]